ncbi:serine/threonine protein kinase [Magnetofaba australis]|nr:serine/threonine protein kinase [Magnetofaba australis]
MDAFDETAFFLELGPDQILNAVEAAGFPCTGHLLALNSYENRVYQVGVEERGMLVAKFYRPGRWSDEQILEEHLFTQQMAELEIPAVPPMADDEGRTLLKHGPFRFALYPRVGGRAPDLESPDHLRRLGAFLGRLHQLGAAEKFAHRPALTPQSFGVDSAQFLLASEHIPDSLRSVYQGLTEDLLGRIERQWKLAEGFKPIRLHGDFHVGNILWDEYEGPRVVDFDDARSGPAIQDIWLCLSGDRQTQADQFCDLLEGYSRFHDLDPREMHLIEALRTLRMLHHMAWIGKRWADPAFPRCFPWFDDPLQWETHILGLREQAALMEEQPLPWPL